MKQRIAHHVATVSQINSQHCAASKLDIRSSMTMNVFVFGGAEVSTKEERLDPFEKCRIGRHHIFESSMLRTILAHDDLTIVFENLCFDFTGVLVHQRFERRLSGDYSVADFFYTGWTKTVGLAREAEWRSTAFIGFEEWTRSPVWTYRFTFGKALVYRLKRFPGDV